MPDPINPAGIPGAELRPDMVEVAATELSGIGADVATQGGAVLTAWQRLAQHYQAPEADTLFGVMDPVKTNAETFGANVAKVSAALHSYAAEVEPIKAELAKIKTDAQNFVDSIAGGVEQTKLSRAGTYTVTVAWHEDQGAINANQALRDRVAAQMVLLWAAERKCANAIYDIIGFPHIEAASDANPNGYGLTDIPDNAETPWGKPVERTESCGERVAKGVIVGGIGGTLVGFGSLLFGRNPQTGEWFDSNTYGAAWSNLGMLAVGIATNSTPGGILLGAMPGPVGDFYRKGQQALLNAGKGLLAWDKWKDDPAYAAGEAIFNVGTILIPVAAATAPVRTSASTAAAAIRAAAKVADLTDPASLIIRGGTKAGKIALPSIADLTRALNLPNLTPGTKIDLPHLPHNTTDLPTIPRTPATTDLTPTTPDTNPPIRTPHTTTDLPGGGGIDESGAGGIDGPGADDVTGHGPGDVDGPGASGGLGTKESPYRFEYNNPAETLRGADQPDPTQLDDVGRPKDYKPGSLEHMQASWRDYKDGSGSWGWERWRDNYIRNQGHAAQGAAFERAYFEQRGFDSGWRQNFSVKASTGVDRNYDIVRLDPDQVAFELKSGNSVDAGQLAKDARLIRQGWEVSYVFGREPTAATIQKLEDLGIRYEVFYAEPVLTGARR